MKVNKIIILFSVIMLMSGCSKSEIKEEKTPTPIPTNQPTEKTSNEPTIQPTINPTVKPTPVAIISSDDLFDPNVWDFDSIQPLINTNTDYLTYNLTDYYVLKKDDFYGIINEKKQIVYEITDMWIPSVFDDIHQHWGSSNIRNTEYFSPDGYGGNGQVVIYDEENAQFKTIPSFGEGWISELLDFNSNNYDDNSLLSYNVVTNVKKVDSGNELLFDKSSKKGVLDSSGYMLTQAIYDDVFVVESEYIPVLKDGLWGYVDNLGIEVIPCIYKPTLWEQDGLPYYPYPVVDGRIVVKNVEGKYGVIDTLGNTLIDFEYDFASPYYDNSVILKKNGEWIVK